MLRYLLKPVVLVLAGLVGGLACAQEAPLTEARLTDVRQVAGSWGGKLDGSYTTLVINENGTFRFPTLDSPEFPKIGELRMREGRMWFRFTNGRSGTLALKQRGTEQALEFRSDPSGSVIASVGRGQTLSEEGKKRKKEWMETMEKLYDRWPRK